MSAVGVLAEAMFKATDALMTNQPCICGRPHLPATDCYMPKAPQGEQPRESPANPQGVHIRMAAAARPDGSDWWPTDTEARGRLEAHLRVENARTFCGQSGGSISLDHYQQNPSAHVSTLPVCEGCHAGVLQEKHDQAMRRKAADGPNHQCLPPRWPDTQDLRRCAWFGHRVEVSVQCCRYVLVCTRCRKTLADLPRCDQGMAKADASLPLTVRPTGPPAPPPNGRIRRGIG